MVWVVLKLGVLFVRRYGFYFLMIHPLIIEHSPIEQSLLHFKNILPLPPMINTASTSEIQKLLEAKPKVVITVHRGPDGDAIGSGLGWMHILAKAGIEAQVIVPDEYPDFLKWMPGNDSIIVFEKAAARANTAIQKADLIFCLDFNAPSRMGSLEGAIVNANKPIVVVDHHQQPAEFALAYYTDDKASSTAELIFRLCEALDWEHLIDHDAAMCLYTGIVTDTGSFRFPSASPRLMRIAAKLMETGIDHSRIYREVFDNNSETQLRLRGFALSERLTVLPDAATAYIALSQADLDKFKYKKGDTEGLVNYALGIKGVNLAGFFAEKDGIIKISLRSTGSYDVNVLARNNFEGGGHINAAGGKSELSLENTTKKFEEIVTLEADKIRRSI